MLRVRNQKGIGLAEGLFIVVLVGIVAIFLIPRFTNTGSGVRQALVQDFALSLKANTALVYSTSFEQDNPNFVTYDERTVKLVNRYPEATEQGVNQIALNTVGFEVTYGDNLVIYNLPGTQTPELCQVTYKESAKKGVPPDVSFDDTDCS